MFSKFYTTRGKHPGSACGIGLTRSPTPDPPNAPSTSPEQTTVVKTIHGLARRRRTADATGSSKTLKGLLTQHSPSKTNASVPARLALYLAGAVLLGFGVVLCVKCEWGVSPINSVPYVGTYLVPLSLGTLSIFFYLVNIVAELILSEREHYLEIVLQLPVSLIFGLIIDTWDILLPSAETTAMRAFCLCGSLFFTALGILLVSTAHLVPDPPTGAVQTISRATKKNMGSVKIAYDCSCVGISLLISLLGAHRIIGFGFATIASAVFVGRVLAFLQNTVGKQLRRRFPEPEARSEKRKPSAAADEGVAKAN